MSIFILLNPCFHLHLPILPTVHPISPTLYLLPTNNNSSPLRTYKKVHYALLRPDPQERIRNFRVYGSLPPILCLEGQHSSLVDGALVVKHRWELPVLQYHSNRVIYHCPFWRVTSLVILHDFIKQN